MLIFAFKSEHSKTLAAAMSLPLCLPLSSQKDLNMKRMKLTRQQKHHDAAYHEAAHVVAHIRRNRVFLQVLLADHSGRIVLPNGEYKTDAVGTVLGLPFDLWMYSADESVVEDALLVLLSGMAATRRCKPHNSYHQIINSGIAEGDWNRAVQVAALYLRCLYLSSIRREPTEEDSSFFTWQHIKTASKFVKQEWHAITKIAEELYKRRGLSFAQCVDLVADADVAVVA